MEKKTKPARFINAVPATASQANNKFWNFVDSGGDSAELQLFGTISSEEDWWSDDCVTYRNFINELKALGDKKNINVLIQSGGGDVFAANAIYTALIQSKATITATVIGLCASAATIILQAASTRRIAKNGVLMAHNPSVTLYGSYTSAQLAKLAEVTDKVKESIMSVYRDRLGKTDDEIKELMNNESWYVGQEAIDNGFCDELIEDSFQNSYTDKNVLTANGIGYNFKNFVNTFAPDAAQLRTTYPDFVNQIVEEAIKAERDRLKDIDSIANGIPNDVLMKAKYEEPLSAADLALAQLRANNQVGQKTLNNLTDDLANSGAGSVGTVPNVGNDGGSQQKAEQREAKVGGLVNALKGDKRRGK